MPPGWRLRAPRGKDAFLSLPLFKFGIWANLGAKRGGAGKFVTHERWRPEQECETLSQVEQNVCDSLVIHSEDEQQRAVQDSVTKNSHRSHCDVD